MKYHENNIRRRRFLKSVCAIGTGIISFCLFRKAEASTKKSQKFLTPDGRLVEVDVLNFQKESTFSPASNQDVLEWMQPHVSRQKLYGNNSR